MALTPQINAPQGQVLSVYNKPASQLNSAQATLLTVQSMLTRIDVRQAQVLAVVKGRVANPHVRVWTFTLDEHDFYVVRLGDISTKIYDAYSQQWPEWATEGHPFWRANCGCNWIGAQKLAPALGSDIVAGDDAQGILWFLNPNQPYDDAVSADDPVPQQYFTRIVMGQVTARGRENIPCYAVFLDGDNYGLTNVDFVPTVTLSYSDDQGQTFFADDTLSVILDPDAANEGYMWTSCGQISSPGRLFRITDNGVFQRIDSLEMNDA